MNSKHLHYSYRKKACIMHYSNRKKACVIVILSLLALFLPACGLNQAHHTVILAGSTSVQPYAEILAEEYAKETGLRVDVQGGGSSAGITAARSGTADFGMSSRHLAGDEMDLWSITIAKDGLAIVVHPSNPVDGLTLEQVRRIYTGEVGDWSEVGGNEGRIHLVSREAGSGTRSAFEELVMDGLQITPRSIVQDSNGSIRQIVGGDARAIGFISLGLVDQTVKGIALDGVEPLSEHVLDGTYDLYRPFLFVALSEPSGDAKEFIDYIMSAEGQGILENEGLISAAEVVE